MKGSDKVKLLVAVGIFVVAIVVIAMQWNTLFGGGGGHSKGVGVSAGGGEKAGETSGGGARTGGEGK